MAFPRSNLVATLDRTLRAILWVALAVGVVALSLSVRQVDLWWQLPDGLALLHTHRLPALPTTAFGFPAAPYVDEYSLYEMVLAALFQIGGLGAIHVAFITVFLLIFALPFWASFRKPRGLLSSVLIGLAAIFMINRFEQRPEVAGVLLLVLLLGLLQRTHLLERGFLLRLVLIMTVWTGVHSSYLIGLAALGWWLVYQAARRDAALRWKPGICAFTFAIACGAVLVNPYGLGRVIFTLKQQADAGSNLLSPEMWPAWDQPSGVFPLMLLTAAILALALITMPRPPGWLGALAVTLFVLTLFHIRHMSFLAATLLFLAAHRRVDPTRKWSVMPTFLLTAACLAVLLFDFVAVLRVNTDLRASPADRVAGFAPALVESLPQDKRGSVLCHDAAGSYLTFARPGWRPYMDSGQGRFDDATKRLYFLDVYDAAAFDRTLAGLPHLTAVLVTAPVDVWTLSMIGRPGWYLAACDDHGVLFCSSPTADLASARTAAASCRDRAIACGDFAHAFCFSALIDPPGESLLLLDRAPAGAWTERLYSFSRAWLCHLPSNVVPAFNATNPHLENPLLQELIFDLQPRDVPLPPPGRSDLERLARVVTLTDHHQLSEAANLLRTIQKPFASVLYYTLQSKLDLAADRNATPAERWQNWNDGGAALLDRTLPLLDAQAGAPVPASLQP